MFRLPPIHLSRLAFVALAPLALAACGPTESALAPPASAEQVKTPARAKNFSLQDQNGGSHELFAIRDAKAIVLIQHGVGCPIVQKMTPTVNQIHAGFKDRGVVFMMLNSNIQDTPQMIKAEADKFAVTMPVLKDQDQAVGEHLGVERTAEAFIIEPKTSKVLYHGPIDDRLTYGRERAKPDNTYLVDGLNAVLSGGKPKAAPVKAEGCLVNFPNRKKHGSS